MLWRVEQRGEESQDVRLLLEEDNRNSDMHDKVQLWESGPYWATMNIGAEKPEDSGYYFWWGDTVGYKRENDKWVASDGSDSNFSFDSVKTPTYNESISTLQIQGWVVSKDGINVLDSEHDAAQVHWGGDWRMPTEREFNDLISKCDWILTRLNGVNGYIVRGRGSNASKSIFFPHVGFGHRTALYKSLVLGGSYWSSVPDSNNYGALFLRHNSMAYRDRYYGQTVRSIKAD